MRCLLEFEGQFSPNVSDFKHHEQTSFFQCRFMDVVRLAEVFEEELPFTAASDDDLQVLCIRTFADSDVSDTVKSAEQISRQQLICLTAYAAMHKILLICLTLLQML